MEFCTVDPFNIHVESALVVWGYSLILPCCIQVLTKNVYICPFKNDS